MKKVSGFLICAIMLAGVVSCSKGGALGEAKTIYNEMSSLTETASEKLEKSSDGKAAGDALTEYAKGMKKLADRSKELQKKYPDFDEKNVPEMNAEQERMKANMIRFSNAMKSAMMKHAGSKELMNSVMEMSQIMSDAGK